MLSSPVLNYRRALTFAKASGLPLNEREGFFLAVRSSRTLRGSGYLRKERRYNVGAHILDPLVENSLSEQLWQGCAAGLHFANVEWLRFNYFESRAVVVLCWLDRCIVPTAQGSTDNMSISHMRRSRLKWGVVPQMKGRTDFLLVVSESFRQREAKRQLLRYGRLSGCTLGRFDD